MKVTKAKYTAFTKADEEGFRSGVTEAFTSLPLRFVHGWLVQKNSKKRRKKAG